MCDECKRDIVSPGTPHDWRVALVVDRGPGYFYRYHTSGENLNHRPESRGRQFSWDVPSIDEPRYDLRDAVWQFNLVRKRAS